jgi:hypothetical protein
MLDDLQMFGRFSAGLRRFLASSLSADECERLLAESITHREQRFLQIVRKAIFEHPRSPYLPLLRHAGVSFESLSAAVESKGIEATLEGLRDHGVIVSLDQFKGKAPLVLGGKSYALDAADFDNPLLLREFTVMTSGSSGKRRRLAVDLDLLVFEAAAQRLFLSAHNLLGRPLGLWRPTPPGSSGIKHALRSAKMGEPIARWFDLSAPSATQPTASRKPWQSAVFLRMALLQAGRRRRNGWPLIPEPIPAPADDPGPVLDWLLQCLRAGQPGVLSTPASAGVRLARLATDTGAPLDGTVLWLGGEPITEAKAALIQEAGATVVNGWSLSETGPLALGCAARSAVDEVHLLDSKVALIPAEPMPESLEEEGAGSTGRVLVTALMPASPKLLLNVDIGDRVTLSRRQCGCPIEAAGFRIHAHGIRPENKLTAGGMHLTTADLLELVEHVLPDATGASALDFQFAEYERAGIAQVEILVHPSIPGVSDDTVLSVVASHLSAKSRAHAMMVDQWQKAGILRVRRAAPYLTATGKKPVVWRLHA